MQPTHLKTGQFRTGHLRQNDLRKSGAGNAGIDWSLVHARLEANALALEHALTPSPGRIEDVYRNRSARLAKTKPRSEQPSAAVLPVLVFRVGPERCAIEIENLAEVIPLGYYAPIPRAPAHFLGVVSVRGELRAVVDLRHLLGLSKETANQTAKDTTNESASEIANPNQPGFVLLLRTHAGGEQLGLKVDRIEELREIRPEELANSASGHLATGLADGSLSLLRLDRLIESVLNGKASST